MSSYVPLGGVYRIPDQGLIQTPKVDTQFVIGGDPRKSIPDRRMKGLVSGFL
jgi:hypothetical protein